MEKSFECLNIKIKTEKGRIFPSQKISNTRYTFKNFFIKRCQCLYTMIVKNASFKFEYAGLQVYISFVSNLFRTSRKSWHIYKFWKTKISDISLRKEKVNSWNSEYVKEAFGRRMETNRCWLSRKSYLHYANTFTSYHQIYGRRN